MVSSNQELYFVQPESFEPTEFLPPSLRRYSDDARYFVSLILHKLARGRVDDNGFVRLRAAYLRNVMSKDHYSQIVDQLLARGVVRRSAYEVGVQSFGYVLEDRFLADQHTRVPITSARLRRRWQKALSRADAERDARLLPVHRHLAQLQEQLEIDVVRARQTVTQLPAKSNPWDTQGVLVADIWDRDFHVSVGNYGRMANNITSLKRELRSSLHVGGHHLTGVDIACCQPALIALFYKTITHCENFRHHISLCPAGVPGCLPASERTLPVIPVSPELPRLLPCTSSSADASRFIDTVLDGRLYEVLLEECHSRGLSLDRSALKRRFLCDVVAKRNANASGAEYPSVVEDAFRALFPTVYSLIRAINKNGREHANLIRILQRLESWLVLEQVCGRLADRHPETFLISLHDAIYCIDKDVPLIRATFREVFEDLDFHMTVKTERPS